MAFYDFKALFYPSKSVVSDVLQTGIKPACHVTLWEEPTRFLRRS